MFGEVAVVLCIYVVSLCSEARLSVTRQKLELRRHLQRLNKLAVKSIQAQNELRRKGVVFASKKSARTAAEGLLALAQNEKKAAIIELNCETDFVALNDIFHHLASSLAKLALLADGPSQPDSAVSPIQMDLMEKGISFHGSESVNCENCLHDLEY